MVMMSGQGNQLQSLMKSQLQQCSFLAAKRPANVNQKVGNNDC